MAMTAALLVNADLAKVAQSTANPSIFGLGQKFGILPLLLFSLKGEQL